MQQDDKNPAATQSAPTNRTQFLLLLSNNFTCQKKKRPLISNTSQQTEPPLPAMLRFNYRPISILKTSLLLSTGFLLLAHLLEARPPSRRAQEKGFLEENAKQPGIVTTKSGLQYQILKEGKGTEFPKRRDTVSIHFQGSLIDGTVFESTRNRENPISMRLSKAVSGYSEAIQLMNIGDQYRFYIPSKLAYGSSKQGEIPPYSVLIFEIELFDIKKK